MSINTDDQGLPAPDGPVISSEDTTVEPVSKKAQKKAAKAARYAEQKAERRAREKKRKKLKRAAAQPEPRDEDRAVPQSKRVKLDPGSRIVSGARLVIDLGFDDKMTEKVPNLDEPFPQFFTFVHRKWYPYLRNSPTHTVRIGKLHFRLDIYFAPLWMGKPSIDSRALVMRGTKGGLASNGGQNRTKISGTHQMVVHPWTVTQLST